MKDNSFAYNNVAITFLDGFLNINNCSIEDLFPNITISDILICTLCVIQLESAYVFRELCRQAAIIWRNKYSANQIIKFEIIEVDNDSQNDISPALVDNVENEQVSGENDGATKSDNNVSSLYLHENKIHLGVLLKCKECHETFNQATDLYKHKKTHLGVLLQKMSENFQKSNQPLLSQKSTHLKVLYKCKECPKTFKFSQGLYYHKKTKHL
jgi:hypothetical protein